MPVPPEWSALDPTADAASMRVRKVRDEVVAEKIIYLLPIGGGDVLEIGCSAARATAAMDARIQAFAESCATECVPATTERRLMLVTA